MFREITPEPSYANLVQLISKVCPQLLDFLGTLSLLTPFYDFIGQRHA